MTCCSQLCSRFTNVCHDEPAWLRINLASCSSSAALHPWGLSHTEQRVTPVDREKIVDWCYAIVDRCRFQRETVAVAMHLVDRFLSAPGARPAQALRDRAEYQLVAATLLDPLRQALLAAAAPRHVVLASGTNALAPSRQAAPARSRSRASEVTIGAVMSTTIPAV